MSDSLVDKIKDKLSRVKGTFGGAKAGAIRQGESHPMHKVTPESGATPDAAHFDAG